MIPVGVLLLDPGRDRLYVRVRRDWDNIQPEEAEVLELMEQGLADAAARRGCWIICKTGSPTPSA